MLRLALAVCAMSACALALPGGYTANGGVFNPDRHLDYMDEARHAGKFAWSQKFEQELEQEDVDRGARQAATYVPTFFTAPQHHQALTAARPQVQQFNPQSIPFNAPRQQQQTIYYTQYRQ